MSLFGWCAKRRVTALLIGASGKVYAGENACLTPRQVCPREPGEGYAKCKSMCGQLHHAEIQCLIQAGEDARGGKIFVDYHYVCDDCIAALSAAGVTDIKVLHGDGT